MKAVVTAGGRGTRLRPITWTMNKHLVPLANEPMIFNAFKKIREAGITDVAIIVNPGERSLQEVCRDGSQFGLKLTYIEQVGGPIGLANTLYQAEAFIGGDDVLLYLGDNIILGSIKPLVDKFYHEQLDCCLALSRVENPQRFGVAIFGDDGRLSGVVEKPENPPSPYAVTGLYIYKGPAYFEAYKHIKPSARGEYEISDIHDHLIKANYRVSAQEMFGWWKDTGKPEDLLEGNQLLLNSLTAQDGLRGEGIEIHPTARIQGMVKIEHGAVIGENSLVRGPAVIGRGAVIENSYIGPYTSIGNKAVVKNSEVEHSIIMDESIINTGTRIVDSIIGYNVTITDDSKTYPRGHKMIVGENSYLEL